MAPRVETRRFGERLLPILDDLAAWLVPKRTFSLQQEPRTRLTSSCVPPSLPAIPLGLRNQDILLPDRSCLQGKDASFPFRLTMMACKSNGCRMDSPPRCWSIPPRRISIPLGYGSLVHDASDFSPGLMPTITFFSKMITTASFASI